jgi:hypothetical protein
MVLEMEKKQDTYVLILGSPRSGTTLLSAMLGCHPEISILNEDLYCSEFRLFSKRVKGNKLCIPNQIELVHTRLMMMVDELVSTYQRLDNKVKRKFGINTRIVRGKKARLSIRDYEEVAGKLYIIGIIRSPKDVIDSIGKRGGQKISTSEYRWERAVEVLYQLSEDHGKDTDISIIHFDRLVADPEKVMKKCLEKINCQYDDSVLEGFIHTPQYKEHHEIDKSKIGGGLKSDLDYPLLKRKLELAKKYSYLVESSL